MNPTGTGLNQTMYSVQRYDNAGAFLDRAEDWLLDNEAANNLVLAIANHLRNVPDAWGLPVYLATLERAGRVVGCAYRTGEYKLGLTELPIEVLPPLVEDLSDLYTSLPAALGPEPRIGEFAELWSRHSGQPARRGMRQRAYCLESVLPLQALPGGRLRQAGEADAPLLRQWISGFRSDVGIPEVEQDDAIQRWLAQGGLYLWQDGAPVSMAACVGRTPHGARVGAVYTPPELRGRGYATACVNALSRNLLQGGLRFCFLYTDLSNPTSNRIYSRIGYRPVCDVADYHFDTGGQGGSHVHPV